MEHRERCDPRMFLTSTLENNSGKGGRWRHSIWSSTRGIQDGRRSRFPFPVAGRINRRAVLSQKLVTFWRRKREEHFLLAKPWEKSNFKLEKLNRVFDFLYARFNLTSKVLKNLYQHCEAKKWLACINICVIFPFQQLSKILRTDPWSETYSKSSMYEFVYRGYNLDSS